MANLSIYFPKQVAIDNPRLWFMQNCCGCLTAIVVFVLLVYTKVGYVNTVTPDSLITAWATPPVVGYYDSNQIGYYGGQSDFTSLLSNANNAAYNFVASTALGYNFNFASPLMVPPCDSKDLTNNATLSGLRSCLMPDLPYNIIKGESIESRFTEEALFIPTAYNEEISIPSMTDAGCPLTIGKIAGSCSSKASYVIPGVEDFRILFFHHYSVIPPPSTFHKMFKIDRSIKGSLGVTLRDKDDNRIAEFSEEEIVNVSLREILNPLKINLDSASGLLANTLTASTNTSIASSIRTRLSGVQLTLNADYRNHMFVRGPVCDIEVSGQAALVGVTTSDIIDQNGGSRVRTYSGVRVRFVRKGSFEYFQLSEMIFSVTTFIVWIRLPGFAIFYFAVFFLGSLSRIYTRFLYEDLNLNSEFNGVSSRLLKRAHGFADLHDLVQKDGTRAISLATVKKRMARILAGRRELDEAERDFFTSFFFAKTCSAVGDNGELAIVLENYLKAVTGEENLRYDDIMNFVDVDAAKNTTWVESFFQDASLRKFMRQAKARREIAQQQEEEDRQSMMLERQEAPTGENQDSESSEGGSSSRLSSSRKSRKSSKGRRSEAAEKQSFMLQNRIVGQRLSAQLDKLDRELEAVRQLSEKVQTRHNDFLHYLAFLNDQTQDIQRDRKSSKRSENLGKDSGKQSGQASSIRTSDKMDIAGEMPTGAAVGLMGILT